MDNITEEQAKGIDRVYPGLHQAEFAKKVREAIGAVNDHETRLAALEEAGQVVSIRTPLVADSTQRYWLHVPTGGTITEIASFAWDKAAAAAATAVVRRHDFVGPARHLLAVAGTPGAIDLQGLTDSTIEAAELTPTAEHLVVEEGHLIEFLIVGAAGATGCVDLTWRITIEPA